MEGLITLGEDILNRLEKSGVIYKVICERCKVHYVGQMGILLNTRVEEHKKNLGRKCNIIMFYLIIERNTLIMTLTGTMYRFYTRKVIREKENLWKCYIYKEREHII